MRQTTAPVTIAIVLVNSIIFMLIHVMLDNRAIPQFLDVYGFNPTEFWINQKVWQPLTSIFVHVLFIHFLFNMLAVWSVGTPLELTLGSGRFAFLYFFSGLSGSLFLMIFNPSLDAGAHGASGAVFGLLGALAIFYPNSRLLVFFIPMRAITAAAILAVLSITFHVFEQFTFIAHMAHLGGLVGGFLYAKFALGLEIGRSDLSVARGGHRIGRGGALSPAGDGDGSATSTAGESFFDRFSRGTSGTSTRADRAAKEAEILRLMRGITSEPESQPTPQVSPPEADAKVEPNKEPPAVDASKPATKESSQRLLYDPKTGRFYIQ